MEYPPPRLIYFLLTSFASLHPSILTATPLSSTARTPVIMSHRTIPVFDDNTLVYSFSARRHSLGHAREHRSDAHRLSTVPKDSPTLLFEALDHARFDQVRRAVQANPACLRSQAPHPTSRNRPLSPIAYALANCQTWTALLLHCRRTGIAVPNACDLTFRERLSAMNVILVWLIARPDIRIPSTAPLHLTLACRLDGAASRLLSRAPWLARSRDSRGKTPLHIVAGLQAGLQSSEAVGMIHSLVAAGADVRVGDWDGATPLHDLVRATGTPTSAHGLTRRRRRGAGCAAALGAVTPVVDALLAEGARLDAKDGMGLTPLDVAFDTGLDYVGLMRRADLLRDRLCGSEVTARWREKRTNVSGMWGGLPDDVIVRIMSLLSPRDVVTGIGATCTGLRRVTVCDFLWSHLETGRCLEVLRLSVARDGLRVRSSA